MLVYVRNKDRSPLMPCKPAKAKHLLKAGKAKVFKLKPFTIQLLWDCEENVQEVTIGIDKGSDITGFSCVRFAQPRTGAGFDTGLDTPSALDPSFQGYSTQVAGSQLGNGEILMSGEIHHRTDIKDKMDGRRGNRKNRRARKWYRKKRFLNRASSRRSGRLPPSIKSNVEEVIRVVCKIPLPISQIVIEDVQVDIAKLNNPDLQGKEYQQSSRLDENLRIATLMRDLYKCTQCNKKGNLDAHHIIWKEHGGKNTIENLITLCKQCHKKIHKGKLKLNVEGVSGFKDKTAQRTMQGKAYLYEKLSQYRESVSKVFGYQTSAYRKALDLPKCHDVDALCVATLTTGEVISVNRENFYNIKFRPRQTRRQYYDLPRKGKGRVRYQVNAQLSGFQKGDIVLVKGFIKQVNSIYSTGMLSFPRIKGEPYASVPKNCRLLEKNKTINYWNTET